jgi:hypothetical protein
VLTVEFDEREAGFRAKRGFGRYLRDRDWLLTL